MREAFHNFSTKNIGCISDINNRNFNDTLTNDVVSFEQPRPGVNFDFTAKDKTTQVANIL